METTNTSNNNDNVNNNINTEKVETLYFLSNAIIIEDSSDTENENEEAEEGKKEEPQVEEKEENQNNKRRRIFKVSEATPERFTEQQPSNINAFALQPVPSVPEESTQTTSIEALEESLLVELQDLTDEDIELMMAQTM